MREGSAARTVSFNTGWLFGPASADSSMAGFDDSAFAPVTVPHTVTPLSWRDWDPAAWERAWVYRKHFDAPPDTDGMRVFLDFSAGVPPQAPPATAADLTRGE
jgi:beta-galactosidase